jgi:hypothetical protein
MDIIFFACDRAVSNEGIRMAIKMAMIGIRTIKIAEMIVPAMASP